MMVRAGGVSADGVSRTFGSDRAVRDVALQVMPGHFTRCGAERGREDHPAPHALGMLRPDQRRVLINGHDVAKAAPTCGVKWGTCRLGVLLPGTDCHRELRAVAGLRGLPAAAADLAVNRGIADLRLSQWADRRTRVLSEGNLQRLGLAGALLGSPDVVILDEPTKNLDSGGVVLVR